MKKWFVLFSIVISMKTYSQDSLSDFNYMSNRNTITGMKVLGSWGIANIGVGAAGWAGTSNAHKYFYQMNTFWGAINTGVALLGYIGVQRKMAMQLTAAETIKQQQKTEKIFLVNAGLDLGYIGVGAYLQSRGNSHNNAKLKGYGSSVVLQGIFLAIFDAAMYKLQRSNGNKWRRSIQANTMK